MRRNLDNYSDLTDLSEIAAQLAAEIVANCAGQFLFDSDSALQHIGLGLEAAPPPLDTTTTTTTREAWHRFVIGDGRHSFDPKVALAEAMKHFRLEAAFPFPSLMPRITVGWRRTPVIIFTNDFLSGMTVCKISARYALILDPPAAPKEASPK